MSEENHHQFHHYGVNHRYNPYRGRRGRFRAPGALHPQRPFVLPPPPQFRPTLFNPYQRGPRWQIFPPMPFNRTHPCPDFFSDPNITLHLPVYQIFEYENSDPNMLHVHDPDTYEAQYFEVNNVQHLETNEVDRNGYLEVNNHNPQVNYVMDNTNMNTAGSSNQAQWNGSHIGYGGYAPNPVHNNVNPYNPSYNFYQTFQTATATSNNPHFVTPGNITSGNTNNTAYSNQSTAAYPVSESNPPQFNGSTGMNGLQNNFINDSYYESNREF